jgi:hypothetical protein
MKRRKMMIYKFLSCEHRAKIFEIILFLKITKSLQEPVKMFKIF